jgi:hypothetical protein
MLRIGNINVLKEKFSLFKIRRLNFNSIDNTSNNENSKINSSLRQKKPPPKKFNPPNETMKIKIPEKEPEELNLKKYRLKDKIAEMKKDIIDLSQPVSIKENYASSYYKLNLKKEFDLLDLRNILYSYLFVRQRNGHIYLNINDFEIDVFLNKILISKIFEIGIDRSNK